MDHIFSFFFCVYKGHSTFPVMNEKSFWYKNYKRYSKKKYLEDAINRRYS